MKQRLELPLVHDPEVESERETPPLKMIVEIHQHGLTVTVTTVDGVGLCEFYVEYYAGQVALHCWDEDDFCDDPTRKVVLIKNPVELIKQAEAEQMERGLKGRAT